MVPNGVVLVPNGAVLAPNGAVLAPVLVPNDAVLVPVLAPNGAVLAPVLVPNGAALAPVLVPNGAVLAPVLVPNGAALAPNGAESCWEIQGRLGRPSITGPFFIAMATGLVLGGRVAEVTDEEVSVVVSNNGIVLYCTLLPQSVGIRL